MTWDFLLGFASCFGPRRGREIESPPATVPNPSQLPTSSPHLASSSSVPSSPQDSKTSSSHLGSVHHVSSLYVFPPTPNCAHHSPILLPTRTRGPSRFCATKSKYASSSYTDASLHTKSLCIKETPKKPPRLRLGAFSSIHPQSAADHRDTYFPSSNTSLPSPSFSALTHHPKAMNEALLLEHDLLPSPVASVPSSVKRLEKKSSLCIQSILPACLVFVSFHSPSTSFPSGFPSNANAAASSSSVSSPSLVNLKRMKWKPYYLSLQPNTETPILRCHREQTLSDTSVSMWVQLPIDVQCHINTTMHMTTLELTGKFPFLVQKKLRFRDSFFSLASKKKKRDTWTRTYVGLSLHFLTTQDAEAWLAHLQNLLVDTSFQVLARVMMQPNSPIFPNEIEEKNALQQKEGTWESELALLHLELKKIQGLQHRN